MVERNRHWLEALREELLIKLEYKIRSGGLLLFNDPTVTELREVNLKLERWKE